MCRNPIVTNTSMVNAPLVFQQADFVCFLCLENHFSPLINQRSEMGDDEMISWMQEGESAAIIGGKDGTLIFRGKPSRSSELSEVEFFFGLDQCENGTKT